MPHYVLQLKRPKDTFAVYSTIVDNLITVPMSARDMRSWLVEHEYNSWLNKDGESEEALIEKYGEVVGPQIYETQGRNNEWLNWHEEEGFLFAREVNGYFCVPRSMWRND
jgi:hypothetical protein